MSEARLSPRRALAIPALALALAIGALLSSTLFGDKILSQADALGAFAPWSDALAAPAAPQNPLLLDQSIVMQPWQHFAAERLQRGVPPLWNPNNYAGQPMVGTYQTAYFWPLNWAFYAWPSERFWAWSAALRIFAAGAFTFLFLRALRLATVPATIGALVFALSGFTIAWLGHMHTHVSLFLPALLWLVERIAQRPGKARDTAALALVVGLALLAGHVQTAVHMALAVAAFAAFRALCTCGTARLAARGAGQVALAGALGGLLAAPQVLPFLDYLADSSGAIVLEDVQTVDDINPLDAAVLSIDPSFWGSPAAAQEYGPYRGPTGFNVNYNELIGGYVGRLALLLALIGFALALARRREWTDGRRALVVFFCLLSLFSAAVAWQVWPVYDVMESLPKLKSTKLMRFGLVLTIGLAGGAAFGAEALLRRLPARAATLVGALLVVVVGAELVAFGRGYNPAIDPAQKAPATAVTDFLRAELPADGSPATWRALGIDNNILMPSANLFYDIPMVAGYDSMEQRTTTELVALMSSNPQAQAFIKQAGQFDRGWGVASLLGVRFVLSPVELPAPLALRLDGPTKVYENPGVLPRAFAARAVRVVADKAERLAQLGADTFDPTVAVLEAAPVGIDLSAPLPLADVTLTRYDDLAVDLAVSVADTDSSQSALVVLADAWDDGWVALLDGVDVPIVRVDHGLRGVWVPPGSHAVAFRYRPASLTWGLGLAGLALCALLGLALRSRRRAPRASS